MELTSSKLAEAARLLEDAQVAAEDAFDILMADDRLEAPTTQGSALNDLDRHIEGLYALRTNVERMANRLEAK